MCVCACASYKRLSSVPHSSYLAWGDRSSGSSCLVCPQSLRLVNVYCRITISSISSRCRRATQKMVWIESFITNTWSNLLLRVELAACRGRLILLHSAASCAAATGASSVVPPAILLQPRAAGDTRLPPLGWSGWGGVEGQETASRAWLACTHAPPCHAAKANFMQPVASVSCSPSSLCPSGIQFQKPFPHSHSEFTILSSEHGLSLIQN